MILTAGRVLLLITGMLIMSISHADGSVPALFRNLAEALEMPPEQDWQKFREGFIKQWGRQPGVERWQIPKVSLPPEQYRKVTAALENLGVIASWHPTQTTYDYAILPGALVPTMKVRLDWLAELWRKGIRFQRLIVLTGQRPLTSEVDHFPAILAKLAPSQDAVHPDIPTIHPMHETEAAKLLLYFYPYPKGMDQVPISVIDAPRKWQGTRWERAHTGETVEAWLAHAPRPGSTLVISSQPSAPYQDAVFKNLLPASFTVETSAPPISPNIPLAVILDGTSNWLRSSTTPPTAFAPSIAPSAPSKRVAK